jgi:molecular chaperone GrpE
MANEEVLDKLAEEVRKLGDLFQRRLLEDKAKSKLYDELYEQLRIARGALADQLLVPLLMELLLLVDRISRFDKVDYSSLESIMDELLEIIERRGVRPIPTAEKFNPAIHEAVAIESVAGRTPGSILKVVRRGYYLGSQLLRPERVVIVAPVNIHQTDIPLS